MWLTAAAVCMVVVFSSFAWISERDDICFSNTHAYSQWEEEDCGFYGDTAVRVLSCKTG